MAAEFFLLALFMLIAAAAYYSFVLMPKQRDFSKRQKMARSLVEGDEVITGGGLVGNVKRIDSDMGVAYVELADGLEVRVLVAALIDRYDPDEIARNARMGQQAESSVDPS